MVKAPIVVLLFPCTECSIIRNLKFVTSSGVRKPCQKDFNALCLKCGILLYYQRYSLYITKPSLCTVDWYILRDLFYINSQY